MSSFLQRFRSDRSGATAIEYGLIAALVAVMLVTVLFALGGGTKHANNTPTVSAVEIVGNANSNMGAAVGALSCKTSSNCPAHLDCNTSTSMCVEPATLPPNGRLPESVNSRTAGHH